MSPADVKVEDVVKEDKKKDDEGFFEGEECQEEQDEKNKGTFQDTGSVCVSSC